MRPPVYYFVEQSDPARNRQFRRGWELPLPIKRKRPAPATGNRPFFKSAPADDTRIVVQVEAPRVAEALFSSAGTA